jgi:hypothetical protein
VDDGDNLNGDVGGLLFAASSNGSGVRASNNEGKFAILVGCGSDTCCCCPCEEKEDDDDDNSGGGVA